MDLQELHQRTGISKRKLRYCIDHQLIPGLNIEIAPDEVGRPRKFHDDVGFGIVCAARLQEQGMPHQAIRYFLDGIRSIHWQNSTESVLKTILERRLAATAHLGDGLNVRLKVADRTADTAWDSEWQVPGNPAPLSAEYEPVVEVILNLGKIFQQICSVS